MASHPLLRRLSGERVHLTTPTAGGVLSGYALLPGFPVLASLWPRPKGLPAQVKRIPRLLNSCVAALDLLQRGSAQVAARLSKELSPHELRICEPIERASLTVPVESFLIHAAQLQDCWCALINRALPERSGSFPASFRKLVKSLDGGRKPTDRLPPHYPTNISRYWQQHGLLLRSYRDYEEHFGDPCSDLSVFKNHDGEIGVRLVLLNNPSDKSPPKAIWGEPCVHALLYVLAELEALVSFTGWLVQEAVNVESASPVTLTIELAGPSMPRFAGGGIVHEGLAPPNPSWIEEVIQKAVDAHNPLRGPETQLRE
jgi:hypothetical protein